MMKAMGRGAGYALWLAAFLVALLLAAAFVPTLFGLQSLVVSSGSMAPAIPVGAVALTREVDSRSISTGDVISYRRRGSASTTTHRVIDVKVEGSKVVFTTRGDANGAADPEPVVVDDRIHRVEHVVPAAGYIVRHARTPLGAVVLFLIPLAGLAMERKKRRTPAAPSPPCDLGWSATTMSLLRLAREPLRSRPSG